MSDLPPIPPLPPLRFARDDDAPVVDSFASRPRPIVPTALLREPGAVLTCAACGCRLVARPRTATRAAPGDAAWRHYVGPPGRDARGCAVDCVDTAHRMASLAASA